MPAREQRRRVDDEVERHVGPDELGAADLGIARRLVENGGARPRRATTTGGAPPHAGAPPTRRRLRRQRARHADRRRERASSPPPAPAHHSMMRRGSARIGASRSTEAARDLAVQPGQRSLRLRRPSAARAATSIDATRLAGVRSTPWRGSILRRCLRALARGRSAMRVADALAPRSRRAARACAPSAAAGAAAASARAASIASPAVPRCGRCALPLAAPVAVCGTCLTTPPPFDAALAAVDYRPPWDRLVDRVQVPRRARSRAVFADA